MRPVSEIHNDVIGKIAERQLVISRNSKVTDVSEFANLLHIASDKASVMGFSDPDAIAESAIIGYADSLAGPWGRVSTMADRALARHLDDSVNGTVGSSGSVAQNQASAPVGEGSEESRSVHEAEDDVDSDEGRMSDFDRLVKLLEMGMNVYMYGPAGSGKTYMAIEACERLHEKGEIPSGVPYILSSPQASYEITGFIDAGGKRVPTAFTEWFMNGGLLILEEMDGAVPEALIAFNTALGNRMMNIPGLGTQAMNPKCLCIATANTPGHGASIAYVTRVQMDMSTLDRFAVMRVDYDEKVELDMAMGDSQLVAFAHDWRRACEQACQEERVLFSYRGIRMFKKIWNDIGSDDAIELVLVRGSLSKDDLAIVCKYLRVNNKYSRAVKRYQASMPHWSGYEGIRVRSRRKSEPGQGPRRTVSVLGGSFGDMQRKTSSMGGVGGRRRLRRGFRQQGSGMVWFSGFGMALGPCRPWVRRYRIRSRCREVRLDCVFDVQEAPAQHEVDRGRIGGRRKVSDRPSRLHVEREEGT